MNGDILLNLDSEDEGELFIGCAGGIDSVAEFTYKEVDVPAGYFCCKVQVKGLKGGHSGGDIHLGLGNANKILNRFLSQTFQKYDMYLCEIDGGNLRNAIAREAHAVIAIPEDYKHDLRADLNIFAAEVQAEYAVVDPGTATHLRIGKYPYESHRQRYYEASAAKPLRLSSRGVCYEPGHSRTGRNVYKPCIRQDEAGQHYPHRNQPTQFYRLIQARYSQYGTYRIRYGRCQSYLR